MRFSIVTSRLSSSLKEVFLARRAVFLGNQMYNNIMARRGTYLQTARIFFSFFVF